MSSEVQPDIAGGPVPASANQAPLNEAADNPSPPNVDQAPANDAASGTVPPVPEQAPSNNVAGEPTLASVERIPINQIEAIEPEYSFRRSEELTEPALEELCESLTEVGMTTPMFVQAPNNRPPDTTNQDKQTGGGTYLLLDGHRRRRCILNNIALGVKGFPKNMPVPCYVLPAGMSKLDAKLLAVSTNSQRESYCDLGRVLAVTELRREGATVKRIVAATKSSESTVKRDLVLGSDKEFMKHVEENSISATNASALLKAAMDANRVGDFKKAFADWLEKTMNEIKAEQARRKKSDEEPLSLTETWPQRYMSAKLVKAWKTSLKCGQLMCSELGFKYLAHIKKVKGRHFIEVEGIRTDLGELGDAEKTRLRDKFKELADDLDKILTGKGDTVGVTVVTDADEADDDADVESEEQTEVENEEQEDEPHTGPEGQLP